MLEKYTKIKLCWCSNNLRMTLEVWLLLDGLTVWLRNVM